MAIVQQRSMGEFVTFHHRVAPRPVFRSLLQHLSTAIEMLLAWQVRSRERRQLLALGDAALKDFGASRCDAEGEGSKPGWQR